MRNEICPLDFGCSVSIQLSLVCTLLARIELIQIRVEFVEVLADPVGSLSKYFERFWRFQLSLHQALEAADAQNQKALYELVVVFRLELGDMVFQIDLPRHAFLQFSRGFYQYTLVSSKNKLSK